MAFLFRSMRSFKVRITLIFFSLIFLAIILFIGFFQIEKQNNYLLNDIKSVEQITEDFYTSTLNLQSALIFSDDTESYQEPIQSYQSNLESYKAQLESLQNNLNNHNIVFEDEFNSIFQKLGSIEKMAIENNLRSSSSKDFYKAVEECQIAFNQQLKIPEHQAC